MANASLPTISKSDLQKCSYIYQRSKHRHHARPLQPTVKVGEMFEIVSVGETGEEERVVMDGIDEETELYDLISDI